MGTKTETAKACLLCKETAEKRGLCHSHYSRYRRSYLSLPVGLRGKFEDGLIEAGKLAPSLFGGKLANDEFSEFAQKIMEESAEYVADEDEITRQSAKSMAKKSNRPSTGRTRKKSR